MTNLESLEKCSLMTVRWWWWWWWWWSSSLMRRSLWLQSVTPEAVVKLWVRQRSGTAWVLPFLVLSGVHTELQSVPHSFVTEAEQRHWLPVTHQAKVTFLWTETELPSCCVLVRSQIKRDPENLRKVRPHYCLQQPVKQARPSVPLSALHAVIITHTLYCQKYWVAPF